MMANRQPGRDESGFTLLEVLISTVVLGFIASGVAAAIILFFRTTDGTSNRLSLSHDSQLLATYLVPDLDSMGSLKPIVAPPIDPTCSGPSLSQLKIGFTGVEPQDAYTADYATDGSTMTRTFTHTVGSSVMDKTTTTVVHNLKHACFFQAGDPARWTMTVTLEANGNTYSDYTFSVTGGRIEAAAKSTSAISAPALCSSCGTPGMVSRDIDGNGKIDHIYVAFDQPLNVDDPAGPSEWTLSGQPSGVAVTGVTVSGRTAILRLSESAVDPDNDASSWQLAFVPDPGGRGIRNGANEPPAGFGRSVTDGVAPVVTSLVSRDSDGNGRIDHIQLTFSKPLLDSYSAAANTWTLTGGPAGVAVKGPDSVSGNVVMLLLKDGTGFDTAAAGMQLAMDLNPNGLRDLAGNLASFGLKEVVDGMAPALTSAITSRDTDHDGKVDQVVMTFSEPVTSAGTWTLSGQSAGVSLDHPSVLGNTVTLFLKQGDAIDTAANGFKVAVTGLSDKAGNLLAFGPTPVADGMGPVIINLTSTPGATAGKLEPGDTLTLTFSEPLVPTSLPASPLLQLTRVAAGNDHLSIPGVADIDLGKPDWYFDPPGAAYASTLTTNGPDVTITVGANVSGPAAVKQAGGPTGMIVAPLSDAASNLPKDTAGNAATGQFTSVSILLF